MGFNKAANTDVVGTFKTAIDRINALATPPSFMLHTGDISHLSKPEEFDTVQQMLKSSVASDVFYVPGEHDVLDDDGKQYRDRFAQGTQGAGWHSFEKNGVHFIGLVNVINLKAGGLGNLGGEHSCRRRSGRWTGPGSSCRHPEVQRNRGLAPCSGPALQPSRPWSASAS